MRPKRQERNAVHMAGHWETTTELGRYLADCNSRGGKEGRRRHKITI
jgi:hypothetical protein